MKIELILLLYDTFLNGEVISRSEFCAVHYISERTFYRYIRTLSAFLRAHKSSFVLDVLEPQGRYYMKNTEKIYRLTESDSKLFD